MKIEVNHIYNGDCLDLFKGLEDESIDMILSDLPYGQTRNSWDKAIPLEPLWEEMRRVIKPRGVIALTGQGLFTAKLIMSAPDLFRYTLVWKKNKPRGFLNANRQPLRAHEDIAVFYKRQPTYNPQKTDGHPPVHSYTKHKTDGNSGSNYGATKQGHHGGGSTQRHPTSILEIPVVNETQTVHPTQKPVELGEWLIASYTNPGAVVVDPACGSGSFCLAAKHLQRFYIGFELDLGYVELGQKRLADAQVQNGA